jgi:hypothetical protein
MTLTCTLAARQAIAGAPISIRVNPLSNTLADQANMVSVVIGVKATNVAPALLSDFLHSDGGSTGIFGDPVFDSVAELSTSNVQAGVLVQIIDGYTATLLKRLDGNYSAGRFLFAAVFQVTPPIAGSVPFAVSAPYLIL